ncbi:eukaryotic translation initiation factor 2-alpha kinase [Tilletia horrida]|uniref:non-specific serine/threonine protein kinase n=1 Tax=Tilletia horrida TaxID=155126 RepID=A0AAN6GTF4_9BASI|nr:eukaryotic translation initiation factor 2-alpha kinase [Tilletia horrida]
MSKRLPPPEELADIQAQEIEALTAILGDDFRIESSASPWKNVKASKELRIALKDDQEQETAQKKSLGLRIHLPATYPFAAPNVKYENFDPRRVPVKSLAELDRLLQKEAQARLGTEMIWDLVTLAQEYLDQLRQAKQRDQAVIDVSLEEEQKQRQKEAEKSSEQAERKRRTDEEAAAALVDAARAEKLKRDIELTTARHTEVLREEKRRVRMANQPLVNETSKDLPSPTHAGDARTITFIDPIQSQGENWSGVRLGPALEQAELCTRYLAEPLSLRHASITAPTGATGPSWLVEQYLISSEHFQSSSGRKILEEIEAEVEKVRNVNDPNLVNVLASSLSRLATANDGSHGKTWRLAVVLERMLHSSVSDLLQQVDTLPWTRVQTYLFGLLAGLQALHSKGLVHKAVNTRSIQICSGAQGPLAAKLRNCCYLRRLLDVNQTHPFVEAVSSDDDLPRPWLAPEAVDRPKHYTQKRDIWELATCTTQMLCGVDTFDRYKSPEILLNDVAREFLRYMFDRSPRQRPSADAATKRLNELVALAKDMPLDDRTVMKKAPSGDRLTRSKRPTSPLYPHNDRQQRGAREPTLTRPGAFWQLRQTAYQETATYSRYRADFEEIKFLGKGAYGSVVKAKNRLDGNMYAIKRIKLSNSSENDERTLREITALSRLSHAHIVRYVTCWIESELPRSAATDTEESEVTSSLSKNQKSMHEEIDLNFGFNDDDFLSRGHQAYSASYPDIQFKNDSDDESSSEDDSDDESEDDDTASESGHPSSKAQRVESSLASDQTPTREAARPTRWLHIQMELVDSGTLKDAIDKGLSVDDAWRYFRQLLEALAHISALGIIHRDIKPANIMVTPSGDVKLGDFGLATTHQQIPDTEAGTADIVDGTELTSDVVGTNLYIAPEIFKGLGKGKGDKVDMYSLGIVFFEMLASQRVYTTGMERVAVLKELRTEKVPFPEQWPGEELSIQSTILRSLLDHNEDARPTAAGLLKSDLLPPKLEDDYIEECLRLMSNPTSAYHHRLLAELFATNTATNDEVREFTFNVGAENDAHQPLLNVVVEKLRVLFERHGAVSLKTPLLMPPNDMYADRKPVQLLDRTGKIVQLPYDLMVAFAKVCARSQMSRFKRYEISPVFRENVIAGSQPRSVLEVDFDIISPDKNRMAEAEVMSLVGQLIDEFPGLSTDKWGFYVNHGEILDILLDRIPDKHRPALLSAVAGLGWKRTNAAARKKLAQLPLARSVLDEIEAASIPGDLKEVQQRLERLIPVDHRNRMANALQQLNEVMELARKFGVQHGIFVAPMMVQGSAYYKGEAFFRVSKVDKPKDVLATGGRYDWLIQHVANPASNVTLPHGVGVQISADVIALSLGQYQKRNLEKMISRPVEEERSFGLYTPRRADVYVASGENMADAKIEIVRMLWAHGISADLAYDDMLNESAEVMASTCRSEGISFLVLMPHPNKLKVRNILRRTEQEVGRHELCSWLATEIARQRATDLVHGAQGHSGASLLQGPGTAPVDGMTPSFPALMASSSANTSAGGMLTSSTGLTSHLNPSAGQGFDFEIVLPDRDKRPGQRRDKDRERILRGSSAKALQEKAARETTRIAEELLYGNTSILVVDMSLPTLQRFASACQLAEDKVFMDLMAGATEDKEYLRKCRRAVEDMEIKPGQIRMLYSSRVEKGVLLV